MLRYIVAALVMCTVPTAHACSYDPSDMLKGATFVGTGYVTGVSYPAYEARVREDGDGENVDHPLVKVSRVAVIETLRGQSAKPVLEADVICGEETLGNPFDRVTVATVDGRSFVVPPVLSS